jgi:hypothetical protein
MPTSLVMRHSVPNGTYENSLNVKGLQKDSTTTNNWHNIVADITPLLLSEGKYWISGFGTSNLRNTGYSLAIRTVISNESMRFKESAPFLFDHEYNFHQLTCYSMIPYVWNGPYGNDLFFVVEGDELIAPPPTPTSQDSSPSLLALIAIPIIAIFIVAVVAIFVLIRRRTHVPKPENPTPSMELEVKIPQNSTKLDGVNLGVRIGGGNFGTVFAGTWQNSRGLHIFNLFLNIVQLLAKLLQIVQMSSTN